MFTNMDLILLIPTELSQGGLRQQCKTSIDQPTRLTMEHPFTSSTSNVSDQPITGLEREECKKIAQTLNWDNSSLIIVSPIQSCLDTCRALLRASERKIDVCVEPLISAKLSKVESVGKSKRELQAQYPQFSFKNLGDCQNMPWYLKYLCREKQKKMMAMLGQSKKFKDGLKEDQFEFRNRIERFRKNLKSHLGKMKEGQRILIISHKEVFSIITAKFFNEKGKGCSDLDFTGELSFVSSSQVFQPLSPSPSL